MQLFQEKAQLLELCGPDLAGLFFCCQLGLEPACLILEFTQPAFPLKDGARGTGPGQKETGNLRSYPLEREQERIRGRPGRSVNARGKEEQAAGNWKESQKDESGSSD